MSEPLPDQLRTSWRPLEEPLWHTVRLLNGCYEEVVIRGALRVEWDAPNGPFTVMIPMRDDPRVEDDDESLVLLAQRVGRDYARWRAATERGAG